MSTQKAQWLICETRTMTSDLSTGDSGDDRPCRFRISTVAGVNVTFPTVVQVNTQTIGIKQSLDIAKIGLNYKLF